MASLPLFSPIAYEDFDKDFNNVYDYAVARGPRKGSFKNFMIINIILSRYELLFESIGASRTFQW
jgi:hypothetical protein